MLFSMEAPHLEFILTCWARGQPARVAAVAGGDEDGFEFVVEDGAGDLAGAFGSNY